MNSKNKNKTNTPINTWVLTTETMDITFYKGFYQPFNPLMVTGIQIRATLQINWGKINLIFLILRRLILG
jgi:hypothetical protein